MYIDGRGQKSGMVQQVEGDREKEWNRGTVCIECLVFIANIMSKSKNTMFLTALKSRFQPFLNIFLDFSKYQMPLFYKDF